MADIMSKKERSKRMSLIRGKWTKQEKLLHNYLKGHKTRHEMHPKMEGSPDIILKGKKVAIFLHGCFWHGCKKCYRKPVQNKQFWEKKLQYNMKKDRRNAKSLRKRGWKVVVVWEHEISRTRPRESLRNLCERIDI